MDRLIKAVEITGPRVELDLTGLLGADKVLDPSGDAKRQAELIEANGAKVGNEG